MTKHIRPCDSSMQKAAQTQEKKWVEDLATWSWRQESNKYINQKMNE